MVNANKRIVSLMDLLNKLLSIQKDLAYSLQGIEIYTSDISRMINEIK